MSSGVHIRDGSCRITDSRDSTGNAHIVPRSEREWFARNAMHHYNSALQSTSDQIDDVRNGFLMRRDLHHAFDKSVFCLAVKEGKVVSHFLERTYEIGPMYHNTTFRLPEADPSVEFVWARFAWSIFPAVGSFARASGRFIKRADGRITCIGTGERADDHGPDDTPRPPKRKRKGHPNARGNGQGIHQGNTPVNTRTHVPEAPPGADNPPPPHDGAREQGNNPSECSSSSVTDPLDTPPHQLAAELEEDMRTKEKFYPLMGITPPSLILGYR